MRTNNFLNAVMLIIFLSGCDLFVADPAIRLNENDSSRQITSFTAVPSGDTSAVTMWNWIPPENWLNSDERIEEIKIIHSTIGYQYFNIPFAGETFTDKTVWKFEWKDLDPEKTHYFSLFLKNEEGNWLPSYRMKVDLPGKENTSIFGFTQSLQVGENGPPYIDSKTSGISIDNSAGPYYVLAVELDMPEDIYIVSATITTGTGGGIETTIPLRVFPVKQGWNYDVNSDEGYYQLTDTNRNDYAVDDAVSAFINNVDPTVNDVTEVIRRAAAYGLKQLVFKIDGSGGSSVNVYSSSFLSVNYISQ